MTAPLLVLEGQFMRRLEMDANAPRRTTRLQRINAGHARMATGDGGVWVFRGAAAGTADFVGFDAGAAGELALYLEVESKAHGGTLNPKQRTRARALTRAGAVHVTVWGPAAPEDMDEAISRALRDIDDAVALRRARRT